MLDALADTTVPSTVTRQIDDLLVGSRLQHPIYDKSGVLLLAAGTELTSDIKQLLKSREITSVEIHVEDADRFTLDSSLAEAEDLARLDSGLIEKLDSIVSGGMLFSNDGPAVRERMVFHGKRAYDPRQHENLVLQHQATSESLDSMMRAALKSGQVRGDQVMQLAAIYLTDMTRDSDNVMSVALESKLAGLSDHALNMSVMAMAMAVEMGMNEENVRTVGVTGLVCDWGMTLVPKKLREAPGELKSADHVELQKHAIYTLNILERISGMPQLVPILAYQIHERPDGSGYPRRRSGESIHPLARILNVADTYIALISPRPYRRALTPYAAMECLLRMTKEKQVDPDSARALLKILSLFPIGSYVALSDGSIGRVLRRNGDHFTAPIVQLLRDPNGARISEAENSIIDPVESGIQVVQALPTPGKGQCGLTPSVQKRFIR